MVAKTVKKRIHLCLRPSKRPTHYLSPLWLRIQILQHSCKMKHFFSSRRTHNLKLILFQLLSQKCTTISTIHHHSHQPLQIISFNTTPLIWMSSKGQQRILRSLWLLNKIQMRLQRPHSLLRDVHSWFRRLYINITIRYRLRMLHTHSSSLVLNHPRNSNPRNRKATPWIWSHSLKLIKQTFRLRQAICQTVKLRLSWHHLTRRNEG